jgi:hypothetical protein
MLNCESNGINSPPVLSLSKKTGEHPLNGYVLRKFASFCLRAFG